ncbi:MAG: hypothetical protein LIO65_02300, partial [Odoribacter sp.]|nr:hypothetical protein [Odoribacter sp.]
LVEFTDASDHVYNLNDRLQIHMVDQTFIRDESTGRLKLAGLASDDIIIVELGSGIQPIEITDFK